jgi:uncharacterized membrane protein
MTTKHQPKKQNSETENKLLGALSYISVLCIIPLLLKREDKFIHDHAKQGVGLFLMELIVGAATEVIGWLPVIGDLTRLVASVMGVIFLIISVIGIIKVLSGSSFTVPLIGETARKWTI